MAAILGERRLSATSLSYSYSGNLDHETRESASEAKSLADRDLAEIIPKDFTNVRLIGTGAHAEVYSAISKQRQAIVALKIYKFTDIIKTLAMNEVDFFMTHGKAMPHTVLLQDIYSWKDHIVLEFEHLGDDVFHKYLGNEMTQITFSELTRLAEQLLHWLEIMLKMKLVHGDVKPENLFFNGILKVIDFGLSFKVFDGYTKYVVQSFLYRSPDVFFNMKLDCSIDMWSLGCMLYELYMGEPLFLLSAESSMDDCRLAMIYLFVQLLGKPTSAYIKKGLASGFYFMPNGESSKYQEDFFKEPQKWRECLPETSPVQSITEKILSKAKLRNDDPEKALNLATLISAMLKYEGRIIPKEALLHPFFKPADCLVKNHIDVDV